MNVTLSLIGFGVNGAPLVLNGAQRVTIKTVLEAFKLASAYPFSYHPVVSPFRKGPHKEDINLVFSLTYKGITLASELAHSAGEEERVWQFYVAESNGMPVSNAQRVPYDHFELAEGNQIKWRLVTVIKQPIETAKRVRNGTTPEQADARHKAYKLLDSAVLTVLETGEVRVSK